MQIQAHLDKLTRLEVARTRLRPIEDFELWFWATMLAGTNALNAALHAAGITPAEASYPSQPGVYQIAQQDGSFAPVLKAAGDVLHAGRPVISQPLPQDIHAMMQAMERIEAYRDPCTRGDMAITHAVVAECQTAYEQCRRLLQNLLVE